MIVEVESDPGPRGEAAPRRIHMGRRTVTAVEILDRWPGADHLYVKLKGDDGALYILRHDTTRGLWELTLFDAAAGGARPGGER